MGPALAVAKSSITMHVPAATGSGTTKHAELGAPEDPSAAPASEAGFPVSVLGIALLVHAAVANAAHDRTIHGRRAPPMRSRARSDLTIVARIDREKASVRI